MIKFMGATDTGKVRQQNQDAFICRRVGENTGYAIVCERHGRPKKPVRSQVQQRAS